MVLIVVNFPCVIRIMSVIMVCFCDQDDNSDRGDIPINRCNYVLFSTMLIHDNIPVVNEMVIILICGNKVLTEAITKANSKWKKIFMFQKP